MCSRISEKIVGQLISWQVVHYRLSSPMFLVQFFFTASFNVEIWYTAWLLFMFLLLIKSSNLQLIRDLLVVYISVRMQTLNTRIALLFLMCVR